VRSEIILINSTISQKILALHPEQYLSHGQYLAGDAAYKLTIHCITPFRKNATLGTSVQRKKFNRHFSKHRVKVILIF